MVVQCHHPRFRTNPQLPGVEQLAIIKPDSSFLEKPYHSLPPLSDLSIDMAGLFIWSCFVELTKLKDVDLFLGQQCSCGCTFVRPLQGDSVAPPFTVGYVKGWRRSVTCLIVAEGIRSLGIPLGDLSNDYKAGQTGLRSCECDLVELLTAPPGIHENYFWNCGAL